MKKVYNQIEKLIHDIGEKINERDDYYWGRSEKWQEGEKGQEYEEKSDALEEAQGDLETAKDSLKTYLEL